MGKAVVLVLAVLGGFVAGFALGGLLGTAADLGESRTAACQGWGAFVGLFSALGFACFARDQRRKATAEASAA